MRTPITTDRAEQGFVLVLVLFILLGLFALTAPFLATARNADAASEFEKNDVQLRLALDAAGRHARLSLDETHPALDPTPYFDGLDEIEVSMDFPRDVFDPADPNGVGFGLDVVDVAGLVDVNSASPHVLGNLLGQVARLGAPTSGGGDSLTLAGGTEFAPGTVISVDGELIRLAEPDKKEEGAQLVSERGLGTVQDDEGAWQSTGPRPPSTHGVGAAVLGQQAFAPAIWRTLSADGEPQSISTLDEIRAADQFALSGGFDEASLLLLRRTATAFGGLGAGPVWQRPTRLIGPLQAGLALSFRPAQGRWMGVGSTVRISDGVNTELRVIIQRGRDGRVYMDRVLDNDYEAFLTTVEVLARRPVNINTAPREVLVALFTNLTLFGQNHRIDEREARALAATIMESRPFTGMRDFAERLVLPAGGIDVLPSDAPMIPAAFDGDGSILDDPRDAAALFMNGLNANDARLGFATMPFGFTSRQVFELELRANVSAKSGIARASGARDRLELVVPQVEELLTVIARQEDFEDQFRLTRAAPFWLTGPETTGRYDGGVTPPSRLIPNLGTLEGQSYIPGISEPVVDGDGNPVPPVRTFASREEDGFVQLDPIRIEETQFTSGRMMHFDQESRTLEGRYLPDETITLDTTAEMVSWTGRLAPDVLAPFNVSMWIRPESGGDGTLMSVGDRTEASDRVLLGMSGDSLVLRVLDGMGDHRDTAFQEVSEIRFPIGSGAGIPGLPVGVWSHVSVDVRGNRPDQMNMLVNGNATGVERLGMTRLTGSVGTGDGTILVESTEGFPPVCALRIGNEIIEATVASETSFLIQHEFIGPNAGFGGRLSRVRFDVEGSDSATPTAEAAAVITGSYAAGTPVIHYGYSLPLSRNVPSGQSVLAGELGPFRVGKAVGLPGDNSLEPIQVQGPFGPITVGRGWGPEVLGALNLSLGDAPEADPEGTDLMAGFNPNGGYAILSGPRLGPVNGLDPNSPDGAIVGGMEVIRYSGFSGNQLQVVARNVELQRIAEQEEDEGVLGGAHAFIFSWDLQILVGGASGTAYDGDELLQMSTFCYPISIGVPGASALSFAEATTGQSQFAQITRLDDGEQTEWVRYDEIDLAASQLVRSDPGTLFRVHSMLHSLGDAEVQGAGGGGGGGGGGGAGPGAGGAGPGGAGLGAGIGSGMGEGLGAAGSPPASSRASAPAAMTVARGPEPEASLAGTDWDPSRGEDPNDEFPLSRAVASILNFRGALDTSIGSHPAGALVLPVVQFTVPDLAFERGRPGAQDAVFIVDGDLGALGYPLTIHRAHYPALARVIHGFESEPESQLATGLASSVEPQGGFALGSACYVAFEGPVLTPTSPGSGGGTTGLISDPRYLGRMVKFPSGEMPRSARTMTIGAGAGGLADFGVASVTVDEVMFGSPVANAGWGGSQPAVHAAGGALLLSARLGETGQSIQIQENVVRTSSGLVGQQGSPLGAFPDSGGLLAVGEEIIAFTSSAAGSGSITVAPGGRGMLGTRPQTHEVTEGVHWLEGWRCSALAGSITPGDAVIPLTSTEGFPSQGTALIGSELIHWTRVQGGALIMPRTADDDGEDDGIGPGAFRGRFGTIPGGYASGTPVILFPCRYWDRYAPRFDGPELGYFGLHLDQPGAWWAGVTWQGEEPGVGGVELVVLQRGADVSWDADPEETEGLLLLEDGTEADDLIPIGIQADRLEWRVFARYSQGAFDAEFGLQHGWKQTPRFDLLGVTYSAPGRVMRSTDR